MTNTHTADVDSTVAQIARLEGVGCRIVRVAVATKPEAEALAAIKLQMHIPLVADVHFDPSLAIAAIEHGADKVRVNPGNMRDKDKLARLAAVARERRIPIRIGVNSGSVRPRQSGMKVDRSTPIVQAMVDALMRDKAFFEEQGVDQLVLSLKSSSVRETIEANRRVAAMTDYPLHLGVTAAGTADVGTIRSATAIGALLAMGIGDTIRVSLTGPPEDEVRVGQEILRSLALAPPGINLLSCPTCSRCEVDLAAVVDEVRRRLPDTDKDLTVAIMGCVVNGPGEAREADVGIVAGKTDGFLFQADNAPLRVPMQQLVPRLLEEINKLLTS